MGLPTRRKLALTRTISTTFLPRIAFRLVVLVTERTTTAVVFEQERLTITKLGLRPAMGTTTWMRLRTTGRAFPTAGYRGLLPTAFVRPRTSAAQVPNTVVANEASTIAVVPEAKVAIPDEAPGARAVLRFVARATQLMAFPKEIVPLIPRTADA